MREELLAVSELYARRGITLAVPRLACAPENKVPA
jgi:hypothetical protein